MDEESINLRLDLEETVKSRATVLEWKKSISTLSLRKKRDEAIQFFHNANICANLKDFEQYLNLISLEEVAFKRNLKFKVAEEEYRKFGAIPAKKGKNIKVLD